MVLNEIELMRRLVCENDEKIVITPIISTNQFGPSSFDIRLGTEFKLIRRTRFPFLDFSKSDKILEREFIEYIEDRHIQEPPEKFILHPLEFALANSLEYFKLPKDIIGILHGRSSWGRMGLIVHATAGIIDPGFSGNITFELANMGKVPISLYPGLRIGQVVFEKCIDRYGEGTKIPYKGKYLEQIGTGESRGFYDKEFRRIRKIIKSSDLNDIFEMENEIRKLNDNIKKLKKTNINKELTQIKKIIKSSKPKQFVEIENKLEKSYNEIKNIVKYLDSSYKIIDNKSKKFLNKIKEE